MSFRRSSLSRDEHYKNQHRFEHWYRDNSVYFITARVRDRRPAFASEQAKSVFWDRFYHYTKLHRFVPWVTSLIDNHYHTLGYLYVGEELGPMMQHIHGSVAKLVNDLLPERITPFWYDTGKQGYFDGCIRDEKQARRAYEYTLTQCRRHGICADWRQYSHTHMKIEVNRAVKRALELQAFMEGVSYPRYDKRKRRD